MKSLTINRVKFEVQTQSNADYKADIEFKKGLNIIYGPNSVGKSSIITGIIYCLGIEKSLGIFQNKQNPFKPEFYDKIEGDKIKKSVIKLEISNGSKTVTIIRSVIDKTDVAGLKRTTIEDYPKVSAIEYLIASGEGIFSDTGLQKFLFDFLEWDIVEVPTFEQSVVKLYLENLAPLFFVEQRSGWTQIQSRQIMRYGIREVKKIVFEYLMGLDRFYTHLTEIERKELLEKIAELKRELKEKEENAIVLVNGKVDGNVLLVERPGKSAGSIHDVINIMEKEREVLEAELLEASSEQEKNDTNDNDLRNKLRRIVYQKNQITAKINILFQEIASYKNYLNRIEINKQKNKQLKKIENLTLEFNISSCPVCENPLETNEEGTCKLCHSDLVRRKLSTPDENLEFLEDEKSSFEKILNIKDLELRKKKQQLQEFKEKEKTITENIDQQIKTYLGPQLAKLREKVSLIDSLSKDISLYKRVQERWNKIEKLRQEIIKLENIDNRLKDQIKSYKQSREDYSKLKTLTTFFHKNVRQLRLLKGKEYLIDEIKIDENDNYTPYLEEYDLYNISSSSDNVRIILSYYLSLLQTSISLEKMDIRFPKLLILDEPKQQNLDNDDLTRFIEILESIDRDYQVILTTYSERERDKEVFEGFIRHEMHNDRDFLLKKVN